MISVVIYCGKKKDITNIFFIKKIKMNNFEFFCPNLTYFQPKIIKFGAPVYFWVLSRHILKLKTGFSEKFQKKNFEKFSKKFRKKFSKNFRKFSDFWIFQKFIKNVFLRLRMVWDLQKTHLNIKFCDFWAENRSNSDKKVENCSF